MASVGKTASPIDTAEIRVTVPNMTSVRPDIIFAGGGLAATLSAARLKEARPALRVLIVEAGARLGGEHTWSFHDSDIDADAHTFLSPYIAHRWPAQEVAFPRLTRTVAIGYNTITSESLHRAAMARLGESVRLNAPIASLSADSVTLADGETLGAGCVIDARGPAPAPNVTVGFQKFLGLEVRLSEPHGLSNPVIMDATVKQLDGFRFVYLLPFAQDRLLVEDTYYSDSPLVDTAELRARCLAYASARGLKVAEVVREEVGCLPVVLGGAAPTFADGVPAIGVRGGFFHHTTSYSLPIALRTADRLAALATLSPASVHACLAEAARDHWREQSFFRRLNRMLFWAAEPAKRYRVLERFYALSEPLIARFYQGKLTAADKARILMGAPPVPVLRALKVFGERRVNPFKEVSS